jgi:catechol 2,3-dioxygenase-like lactoylglutathione lyase family enzyme
MAVLLDHMTVYTTDKLASAEFYARVFGAEKQELRRAFAPVQVGDALTLNLEEAEGFTRGHYAFLVTAAEFDAIRGRLEADGISYGSRSREHDSQVYTNSARRGFYFDDPSGHGLEVMTAV